MDLVFQLLLIVFLILINAYFVASELALVSIRKTRIDELAKKGNKVAKIVQSSLKNVNHFISATQFGITLISLMLGWIGEPITAHLVEYFFQFLPRNLALVTSHTLAVIIGFILITFIDIVFGELVPKNIAMQRTEKISFLTISPLIVFANIFQPFVWILTTSSNFILRLLGFSQTAKKQLSHSEDEIKIILSESALSGEIEKGEAEMVNKVFRIADLSVQSIMIPRELIVAFDVSSKLTDVVTMLQNNSHSRFPVYNKTLDKTVGFIHVKDVYKLALATHGNKRLIDTTIIREIIRISETKRVDDVIIEMRKKRIHLALVEDRADKTVGIVTLEDLLESIVGEIQDEFEKPSSL